MDISKEAYEVWERMQAQIRKLASKVSGFSNMYEENELEYGLAYIACYEGCLYYNKFRKRLKNYHPVNKANGIDREIKEIKNMSDRMRKETFVYWYLQKKFFKEAGTNEVCYIVIGPDGEVKTYINGEFRKKYSKTKIKELEIKGYKFISDRVFKMFSELVYDDDKEEKRLEIAADNEEFRKYCRKNRIWR